MEKPKQRRKEVSHADVLDEDRIGGSQTFMVLTAIQLLDLEVELSEFR